jgi:hypothetical protein
MMNAAAVIIARQNKYLRAFQQAGATAPECARDLADLGLRDSRIFRGMLRRGYVMAAAGGFYVNLVRVAERRRRARLVAAILLTAALMFVVLAAAAGLFRGQ